MPTQTLAAVLCRGLWAGGDEGCPANQGSLVKLGALLLASVRKRLWRAGDVLIPWGHGKCSCALAASPEPCHPAGREACLAQAAPTAVFTVTS